MVQQDSQSQNHAAPTGREPPLPADGGRRRATSRVRPGLSLVRDVVAEVKELNFIDQAMLFGAGLLTSLLPFLILLSAFASARVDDDIALRLGLDRRAAGIMSHLFTPASATLSAATVTSLIFVAAGTLTMASSLQQIYEKAFRQGHRGVHDLPRLLTWVAAVCGVVAFESVVGRPVREAAGGSVLVGLLTFVTYMFFFWWTIHFLLRGRISWRRLLPPAVATGVGFVALGVFARFYFSASIVSDDKTYGAIGAVFSLMTWLIGIGAVIMLGAVGGAVWQDRREQLNPPPPQPGAY